MGAVGWTLRARDCRTFARSFARLFGRTEIPPLFYRTTSPSGPLPKKEPCLSCSALCNANLTSLIDEADHGAEEGVSGGDDDGLRKWAALAPEGPPAEREKVIERRQQFFGG